METKTSLETLIDKYRFHMDFAELDLSDINQQCFPNDDALIHLVARVGTLEEIELLVASKALVNSTGDLGYTPLHYAAMRGRLDMTKKLLGLGANPKTQNEFGETPVDIAHLGGHSEIAKLLNRYK